MIIIYFYYRADNQWKKGEKIFYDIPSAVRFCWSMKKNRKLILDGWSTYSQEENEAMQSRVNIAKINGWKI